jgi:hypothetical protein
VLASAPKNPVQLDIHDESGQLVRSYSSADTASRYSITAAGTAPEWFTTPSMLATTRGLHRFIWPLRYAALPAIAGGNAYADGAWAPPGRYTVALKVDGQTYQQPLTIVPDPRVKLPPDAYARQFAFARMVEAAHARLATAQAEAKQLHTAVHAAQKLPGSRFNEALTALDRKVVDIAGLVDAPNPNNAGAMPPKNTHTFAFLAQALGKLGGAADDADAAPSPDAHAGYSALMPMLEMALAEWQQLQHMDLAALDAQLRSAGEPELTLVPALSTTPP